MNHLGLFAKFWAPGKVKTRLAAGIGEQPASRIYFVFLRHLLRQLGQVADTRTLAFSPVGKRDAFASLGEPCGWKLTPQHGNGLGERMKNFFDWGFEQPDSKKVILVGSDTPHLSATVIEQAFQELNNSQIVIGPSTDGGYYLIGMAGQNFPVFDGIEWSTDRVLPQTIRSMESQGIRFSLLEPMTDVDEFDEYQHLKTVLKSSDDNGSTSLLEALLLCESEEVDSNE